MRDEIQAKQAIELYSDMIRRICFMYLKNYSDVEDIFQEVFLKYILYFGVFENKEHEKAWFARVTINSCKDMLKNFFRKNVSSIDDIEEAKLSIYDEHNDVLNAVLKLPNKYKDVIYLFYYERYTATEIANILKKNENTIYTWLSRGKKMLKEILGGDYLE